METLNKILRSMMEVYGLDPETSDVINSDEPARMKKKKNKTPFKGKSQHFVEEASENETDIEVHQTRNMKLSLDRKRLTVISFQSTSGNQRENQDYVDLICKLSIYSSSDLPTTSTLP